jgi:hypothetical protein
MPVFAVAAFFEGFVTRYYNMPVLISSSILLVSAVFLTWYFIIYPVRLQKKFVTRSLDMALTNA